MIHIIKPILDYFKNNSLSLVNVETDGDLNRRKAFNTLRKPNTELKELLELPLFEKNMFDGDKGINYDPKHLAKRIRGIFII